jgi:ribosomal protein S18 acetylase RimI-like enzyme
VIRIRTLGAGDAEAFLSLLTAVDAESPYMLYAPGERRSSPDKERARLNWWRMAGNSTALAAEADGFLVGYALVTGGTVARNRHCAVLEGLAVRRSWRRQGIGGRLLAAVVRWAGEQGLTRLELGVMAPNAAALSLYERHGFAREGVKRGAYCIEGTAVDQVLMARLLEDAGFFIDKEKTPRLGEIKHPQGVPGT